MTFTSVYKKYIEPFTAIIILVMLYILVAKLYAYNNFQEEIAENCGWEKEDTRCYCEKGAVIAWENEVRDQVGEINLSSVNGNG